MTTRSSSGNSTGLAAIGARLVDICGADERARERISGALNLPLDRIGDLTAEERPVVFHCRTGMRTAANAAQLADAAHRVPAYILNGGIDAWRSTGHPTITDRTQPMKITQQVQITAGAPVLSGVLIGLFVAPGFFGMAAFVGAGLMFTGRTAWCGMAKLFRILPWNRQAVA